MLNILHALLIVPEINEDNSSNSHINIEIDDEMLDEIEEEEDELFEELEMIGGELAELQETISLIEDDNKEIREKLDKILEILENLLN